MLKENNSTLLLSGLPDGVSVKRGLNNNRGYIATKKGKIDNNDSQSSGLGMLFMGLVVGTLVASHGLSSDGGVSETDNEEIDDLINDINSTLDGIVDDLEFIEKELN